MTSSSSWSPPPPAQSAEIHSTTLVATGVWYHVAAMRGSNFTQLYVNGRLESQTNVSFAQDYGTLPLYFGTSGQSYWDHKFNGHPGRGVPLQPRPGRQRSGRHLRRRRGGQVQSGEWPEHHRPTPEPDVAAGGTCDLHRDARRARRR